MSPPYDLHPAFRKHAFPNLPLSSGTYEDDARLVSSIPTETKPSPVPDPFLPAHISPSPTTTWTPSFLKTPVRNPAQLPIFAISPDDKIVIDPADMAPPPRPPAINLMRTAILTGKDKGESHSNTIYSIDISPGAPLIIASKQGDRTLRIHSLVQPLHNGSSSSSSSNTLQAVLKTSFYLQMQERSRDFFVSSHAILSATRSLVVLAVNFGHTLEIWDWARRKKLQVLDAPAYRWAAPKTDIYLDAAAASSSCPALACYREDHDAIYLYPVAAHPSPTHPHPPRKPTPPLGPPTIINLTTAHLPHLPKFPELALSSTPPRLLVAAAGPRPPRPGHPPPTHAALLLAWPVDPPNPQQQPPFRMATLPAQHAQLLATALPCGLATHRGVAVSLWIPHHVRVIGRPGAWQVEPVAVPERYVLVWRIVAGATSVFAIPNYNTLACVSPDCRWVAYRQGPGADTVRGGREVCLVVLDALRGGREVWRTPVLGGGGCRLERDCGQLMDLSRVTALAFSGNGGRLLIGDTSGSVGVYEIRTDGPGGFDLGVVM